MTPDSTLPARSTQTPMDRAEDDVERCTGVPKELWQDRIGHPYNRAALKRAKQLAGILDEVQRERLACRRRGVLA